LLDQEILEDLALIGEGSFLYVFSLFTLQTEQTRGKLSLIFEVLSCQTSLTSPLSNLAYLVLEKKYLIYIEWIRIFFLLNYPFELSFQGGIGSFVFDSFQTPESISVRPFTPLTKSALGM